jgi:predicted permease
MTTTLVQMALLISCGIIWRFFKPASLGADQTRLVLTTVVYYLLLPAMILHVLWQTEIGFQSLKFSQLSALCIFFGLAVMWLWGKLLKINNFRLGALVLAAGFPNVTYLGLPVLEQTFGPWARSIAIQMDLFAGLPLLFTVGILIARYFGEQGAETKKPIFTFLNTPPFWAAALAVSMNLLQISEPSWLSGVLQRFAAGVVPLMLFSLGLALNWQAISIKNLPYAAPVIVVKMLLMPLFAIWLNGYLDIKGEAKTAALLETAMPCMVLGIVFCDRYRLDASLYAMVVTVTTLLSLVTLPFWYRVMQ